MANPTAIAPRPARQQTKSLRDQHKIVRDTDGTTVFTKPSTSSASASQLSRKLLARITCRQVSVAFVCIIVLSLILSDPEKDPDGSLAAQYRTRKPDGYNLGHFLNLTALVDKEQRVPPSKALSFADSIAARYVAMPGQRCTHRVQRSHLRQLFASIDHIPKTFSDLNFLRLAQRTDTLTVQLCVGHKLCGYGQYRLRIDLDNTGRPVRIDDDQSDTMFKRRVAKYAMLGNYSTVLLVPALGDARGYLAKRMVRKLKYLARAKRFRVLVRSAAPGWAAFDNRALILARAANLVVHRGVDGALAALVSNSANGVLMSEAFRTFLASDVLKHAITLRPEGIRLTAPQQALNGMGPVHESCCKFLPLGKGDSAKVLCQNPLQPVLLGETKRAVIDRFRNESKERTIAAVQRRHACWVLSLGCGNRWSFEEDVIDRTACSVHVFDCTANFKVPSNMRDRVRWTKACVGPKSDAARGVITWKEVIDIGSEAAGLPKGTVPTIAKVDVEGWEFPVLSSLINEPAPILPKQLLIEVHAIVMTKRIGYPFEPRMYGNRHYGASRESIKELFDKLFRLGYQLVHRVDNPYCTFCAEVTLLQSSAFPPLE